jgi:hypothetical protein
MAPEETTQSVATFFTTHAALRADKVLKQEGIAARLIPAPRYLSADCTIALLFAARDEHPVRAILEKHGVETSGFHRSPSTR